MNVYDFDGTIYNGDSTRDFFFYLLKKDFRVVKVLPGFGISALKYYFGTLTKTKMKESFYRFLTLFKDGEIANHVINFWKKNKNKIYSWYYDVHENSDVVISASPRFILGPICKELKVHLICSEVNANTGKYSGLNCHGEEKVNRFYKEYKDATIDKFYSDLKIDLPLASLAKEAFLVKRGGKIIKWKL